MTRLPCYVEVDTEYVAKARYALAMLLEPLGVEPIWVERASLTGPGLYYGPLATGLPDTTVKLSLGSHVEEYFSQRTAYLPDNVTWKRWDDWRYPILFADRHQPDWVASTFFWLSGWQEYVTKERDSHGRFPHAASLQNQLKTTALPVVDIYRQGLQEELERAGIQTTPRQWGGASWALCPTIDVDYLRKWRKGIIYRELVEYFLLNRKRTSIRNRLRRLFASTRQALKPGDPFRTALERMLSDITGVGAGTLFLKAAAHGPQDVRYDLHTPYIKSLVTQCQRSGMDIGLHPSYHAHTHPEYLHQERSIVTELTGTAPITVRQHYLRCESPVTHRLQSASGFRIDSTLGFATNIGFRNGTCLPFKVFDVQANRALDIWEIPLTVMDSALFNRQNLTPDEAIEATKDVLGQCARFGGVGVVLWHNVLWDELDFPGWGRHFESIMQWGVESGARIMSLQSALESWLGHPLGTQPALPG